MKILNPFSEYSNSKGSANTSAWADDTIQSRNSHTPANLMSLNEPKDRIIVMTDFEGGFLRNRLSTSTHCQSGVAEQLEAVKEATWVYYAIPSRLHWKDV